MKKTLCLILMVVLSLQITSFAEVDDISVIVDDTYLSFDQPPVMHNDRVLVPLRVIFEALNATVEWDDAAQTVTSTKGNTSVIMQINNLNYSINGEEKAMDVPPLLLNGRTLIPVRAVAESFGCIVDWDDINKTVIIDSNIKLTVNPKSIKTQPHKNDLTIADITANYPELVSESSYVAKENINAQIYESICENINSMETYIDEIDLTNVGAIIYNCDYGITNISNNLFSILYTESTSTIYGDNRLNQYAEVYKLDSGDKATLTDYFSKKTYEEIIAMFITDFNMIILQEPELFYEDAAELVEIHIDDVVVYPCGSEIAVTFNPGVIAPYDFGFKTLTYPAEY